MPLSKRAVTEVDPATKTFTTDFDKYRASVGKVNPAAGRAGCCGSHLAVGRSSLCEPAPMELRREKFIVLVLTGVRSMPQYIVLSEDQRNCRRTIADAIEVLCTIGFTEADRAQIEIALLKLPSAHRVGLVQVMFDQPSEDCVYVASLPTSQKFRAWDPSASRYRVFEIQRLDKAEVNSVGHVQLVEGLRVRAVEVIPAWLPLQPTELELCIIHSTVALTGSQKRCYR